MMNMVKSMTGYGNDTFQMNETVVTVEIKSVNSRYLDIISNIPRSLQEIEYSLKKMLQTYFSRGRIELYITLGGEPLHNKKVVVDWQLLDEYMQKFDEVRTKYNIKDHLPLSAIAEQDSLFVIQEVEENNDSFHEALYDSVKRACERIIQTREQEGQYLKQDVLVRIDHIQDMLAYIESSKEDIQQRYRKRMEERVHKHLVEQSVEVDENLLIQEVAVLAEKGDIHEEITRICSHIDHFKTVIEQDAEVGIGRKLDFIVQEMHRETNTIGAKSIDAKISEKIVTMKSEIEKIKEQIQNIE